MREEAEGEERTRRVCGRPGSLVKSEEEVCIGTERDPGPARAITASGGRESAGRGPRRVEE